MPSVFDAYGANDGGDMWKLVLAAALVMSACTESKPAHPPEIAKAGWQFLNWGMSPDDVLAASKGALLKSRGDEGHRRMNWKIGNVGKYSSGAATFDVYTYFSRVGLAAIALEPKSGTNCERLLQDLTNKYGEPEVGDIEEIHIGRQWQDRDDNLQIYYGATPRKLMDCSVLYEPFISAEAKGL